MRQRCQMAPGRFAAIASIKPGWASLVTRRRPVRGDQVGEERVPRGLGLGGGDLEAEDLAVAVAVDAGGHQHDGVDHPAAFADLHGERVGSNERERAGVCE